MTQVTNTPYEALEVGQTASYSKLVEERDIQLFAAMSGDHNPVHLDAEYAKATMFKERIAHGMFSGALISAAVACELPASGLAPALSDIGRCAGDRSSTVSGTVPLRTSS